MSVRREQLAWPGTQDFERLQDFRDKFRACGDALLWEEAHDNREYVKRMLEQELFYWRSYCVKHDPEWDMKEHLVIPVKGAQSLVPHEMKPIQERVHKYIQRKKADKAPAHPYGSPIQCLGPKSRRHGLSQQVAGEHYIDTRNTPYMQALVMAHREDSSADIFRKYTTYWENDDKSIRPEKRRGNKGELLFDDPHNGGIWVMTAGMSEAGQAHGSGFHRVHISEETRFRHPNTSELLTGIAATIPGPNEAFTMFWRETTGFGQQGGFYSDVMSVVNGIHTKHDWLKHSALWESIDSGGWDVMFASSIDRWDAWLSFNHDRDCAAYGNPALIESVATYQSDCGCKTLKRERAEFRKQLTDEEKHFVDKCGATLEWIKWWRFTFEKETKALVDMGARKRKQRETQAVELIDCFQATGNSTFDLDAIHEVVQDLPEVAYRCELHGDGGSLFSDITHRFERHTPHPVTLKREDGWLHVFEEEVEAGDQYCFGVDLAEGTVKGDFSTVFGINQTKRRIAFAGEVKMSLVHFVEQVRLISKKWNDAFILPEVNFNTEFTRWLGECDRKQFLAIRINPTGIDARGAEQMQHGYRTTETSKIQLVNTMKLYLAHEPQLLGFQLLLDQMQIFREELTAQGRTKIKGAVGRNAHDDMVIAAGLCFICDQWNPARRRRGQGKDDGLPPISQDNPAGHYARMVQAADKQERLRNFRAQRNKRRLGRWWK